MLTGHGTILGAYFRYDRFAMRSTTCVISLITLQVRSLEDILPRELDGNRYFGQSPYFLCCFFLTVLLKIKWSLLTGVLVGHFDNCMLCVSPGNIRPCPPDPQSCGCASKVETPGCTRNSTVEVAFSTHSYVPLSDQQRCSSSRLL